MLNAGCVSPRKPKDNLLEIGDRSFKDWTHSLKLTASLSLRLEL